MREFDKGNCKGWDKRSGYSGGIRATGVEPGVVSNRCHTRSSIPAANTIR